MLSLEEAQERILAGIQLLKAERVAVAAAAGRFLAEPILAPMDLPQFDNSAMDGYAVRAAEVTKAGPDSPVRLKLIGSTAAGEVFRGALQSGTCVRLFTGSALPAGADAVVMQEDTRVDATRPGEVDVLDEVRPWENVRLRGEDVKRGAPVAGPGERIAATRAGLLAALGIDSVMVRRQPVVGLLATGSELLEAGQPVQSGKIFESNRITLAPLLTRAGAVSRPFPLVRDSLEETRQALTRAFADCDAVVTTGGVSVGALDFVKSAFEQLGGVLDFWKVSIRPGKPFVFGRLGEKFLFGLPGNPVSAVVTFLVLVRPALLCWQGGERVEMPSHPGTLSEPLANAGDRRHFMRVWTDEQGAVRPAGGQSSHLLGSLALSNGLVDVPPKTILAAGTSVRVLRIEE
ncbi:MAG TPA: gephyrin-like molybdotransferase Glp [Verrucomicrobiae bacterium]|nr:gephyrin-like molybdotransferase Glp [Verrucomicrobiae bacterium]